MDKNLKFDNCDFAGCTVQIVRLGYALQWFKDAVVTLLLKEEEIFSGLRESSYFQSLGNPETENTEAWEDERQNDKAVC